MARISTYAIDTIVTAQDKWIGTDSNGTVTKNFTASDVAAFLNTSSSIESTGTRFKFKRTSERSSGSFVLSTDAGTNVSYSSVSNIEISVTDAGDTNVSAMYTPLVGSIVLIRLASNPSSFGVYKWSSAAINSLSSLFYDVTLTFQGGNGGLESESDYLISLLTYDVDSIDKNFIFTQATPSNTWNVNHNLNKFPSATIVDTAGTQVVGKVEHSDLNNLTISFAGSFAGKAFIN
ncbi:MAG: hypothetical protein GOVbin3171_50 [Prokaryotic dsDNA virus sp.]|nr:MAG: hypothetical protein GOVbin3171_50 [Prokaryotic dsDNA virus sp.]|tara:strand:- start:5162 stop:5863 length:702 start_codon:yes stop_codon:yes gene_type:complete